MKKILALFLILSLCMTLNGCRRASRPVDGGAHAPITLLFAGLDEAAENTDVLCLVSVDASMERITVLQIPRDTYYRSAPGERINAIYASARYAGASEKEALSSLSAAIESTCCVSIDGAIAVQAAALAATVDFLGGVELSLPFAVTVEEKHYEAGTHHLSGADAEAFIRYREGYLMGDLGRVDAQKLFLCALLGRARQSLRPSELIRMLFSMREDVITDLSLPRALSLGLFVHARLSSLKAYFATLPGEPLYSDGHWYYIVNRKGAISLLSEYFSQSGELDGSGLLFRAQDPAHQNIYNDKNSSYHVYTEENLSSLKIQTKKE